MEKKIEFTRGDTFVFTFTLTGDDLHLDEAYFTVRKKKDTEILFQRSLENGITDDGEGKYTVRIAPENTEKLQPGSYLYDLEIRDNQDVLTPLKGTMKLAYDITYEEE